MIIIIITYKEQWKKNKSMEIKKLNRKKESDSQRRLEKKAAVKTL